MMHAIYLYEIRVSHEETGSQVFDVIFFFLIAVNPMALDFVRNAFLLHFV